LIAIRTAYQASNQDREEVETKIEELTGTIQERSTETEEVGGASESSGGGGVRFTDEGKMGYGSGTWRGGACASGMSRKTRTQKINN
jgi:hypothetical protein